MSESSFSPALGLAVEYRGYVGEIRFVDSEYLTICTKKKDDGMIGDVCMVVYPKYWDQIKLLKSSHS